MAVTQPEWDIVSSIGLTALAVAAARAIETTSPHALIEDPFAAEFVHAADPPRPLPTEPVDDELTMAMSDYVALRSRYFDELITASEAPQLVILAAGLDARAFRLDLTGRDVYEVDQPRVLAFKGNVLDRLGARPRCRRHAVAADLREDWLAELERAGFDRARPTVWLAEGLLPYLPGPAEEALFEVLHELSAPGSRIGVEHPIANLAALTAAVRFRDASDLFGIDVAELFATDARRNALDWLADRGWQVAIETPSAFADRHRRAAPELLGDGIAMAEFAAADLP